MCELTDLAVRLVCALAKQHRVSPHHLALAVPGLCHSHHPSARRYADCAYCRREGNVYAPAEEAPAPAADPADLLARFAGGREPAAFGDAVLDAIRAAKNIDVEAVRAQLLAPLRPSV